MQIIQLQPAGISQLASRFGIGSESALVISLLPPQHRYADSDFYPYSYAAKIAEF